MGKAGEPSYWFFDLHHEPQNPVESGISYPLGGFEVDCGLKHRTGHLPHLLEDRYRCRRYRLQVGSFYNMLDDTLATVHQLPYDQVTIHGVPPDEMVSNLAIPQDTLWTLYLHSEGTPGNLEACKERESTYYCICQY
jgi:hypothetical protein